MGSPPIFDSDDIKDSWRRIERGGENGFYFFNVLSLLSAFLNGTGGRKVGTSRLEREYRLLFQVCFKNSATHKNITCSQKTYKTNCDKTNERTNEKTTVPLKR